MAYPDYEIGLKRITEVGACLLCGNNTVKETRKFDVHTNGHWNESIEFACGIRYAFSPNYMRVGQMSACRRDPKFAARKENTARVKEKIFKLAEKEGIHEDEMSKLRSALEYWRPADW
jgi:hypothetical protein